MKSNPVRLIVPALTVIAALSSCREKEKPSPGGGGAPNEEELITTVQLHFLQVGGAEQKHFTWRDLDGDGGNAPVIDADTLTSGLTYQVSIEVLDESVSPADSITAEILSEGAAHQFFFQVTSANASVAYADADGNGDPVGLETIWTIGTASSGTVLITLRHEPNKGAAGVSAGDITNAGGETDIAVSFPLVVQ